MSNDPSVKMDEAGDFRERFGKCADGMFLIEGRVTEPLCQLPGTALFFQYADQIEVASVGGETGSLNVEQTESIRQRVGYFVKIRCSFYGGICVFASLLAPFLELHLIIYFLKKNSDFYKNLVYSISYDFMPEAVLL